MKDAARIDYDKVAPNYDRYRRGGDPYLNHIVPLAREGCAWRVLELAAGTGSNTSAFLDEYPCELVALERSGGMLDRARAKPISAGWVQGDATRLPLASDQFDLLFAIFLLHHVTDLDALFEECMRVLDGGCAAFVTVSHEFIARHPMAAYFPSFKETDQARFPGIPAVRKALQRQGFERVETAVSKAKPTPIDSAYVDKVAAKFISTYELIPDDEFEEGLARLRRDVSKQGQLEKPFVWEATTIWGYAA